MEETTHRQRNREGGQQGRCSELLFCVLQLCCAFSTVHAVRAEPLLLPCPHPPQALTHTLADAVRESQAAVAGQAAAAAQAAAALIIEARQQALVWAKAQVVGSAGREEAEERECTSDESSRSSGLGEPELPIPQLTTAMVQVVQAAEASLLQPGMLESGGVSWRSWGLGEPRPPMPQPITAQVGQAADAVLQPGGCELEVWMLPTGLEITLNLSSGCH